MYRFSFFAGIFAILAILLITPADSASGNTAGRVFCGNVYGTIQYAESNARIADARIYICDAPVAITSKNNPDARFSNIGWVAVPDPSNAVRSVSNGPDGSYLVNNIPINGSMQVYTVMILPKDAAPVIVDAVPVLPGAIMALQIDVLIQDNDVAHVVEGLETSDQVVTNNYRHKLRKVSPPPPMPQADEQLTAASPEDAYTLTIYATREGLVGGTTANGHVIVKRDHFVALPSTRVLCSKGGYEYQVKLEHLGYRETVPVWDIGPWNIHDNYWDVEKDRLIYQYLSDGGQTGGLGRGLPEAQAAYQDDFNNGYDEYRRKVANPAGIDLADGTYWDALRMEDNAWINVSYLWIEDDGSSSGCFINAIMQP